MIYNGFTLNQGYQIGQIVYVGENEKTLSNIDKTKKIVIIAKELTPHETVAFRKYNVVAMVVERGSPNSHVSILARVMGIPAVVMKEVSPEWHGMTAIVDGAKGSVVIGPDETDLNIFYHDKEKLEKEMALLDAYKGMSTKTKNGTTVNLLANITCIEDLESVTSNDAEGIGNFKTEFMFLNSENYPNEFSQFEVYREIASRMNGKKVIIRTIDIGADKTPSYLKFPKEDNPALGYRAIRMCLENPEIFMPQIKAILRASAYGNVSIMYPMITSEDEIIKIKEFVKIAMLELSRNDIPFNDHIEQGIMIETPASVIMSRELAKHVDFFSIGTNDLTQYMLAADRSNPMLNHIVDPYHPSIMRSIKFVINNAHAEGIWVSLSGELGADLMMTKRFIEYGLDALTVSPNKILELRKMIREI